MTYIMHLRRQDRYTAIMKRTILSVLFVLALLLPSAAPAACNVCHSKDPKMVHMHSALGFKDCFTCHGPARELPTKERISERPSDLRCMPCHKN